MRTRRTMMIVQLALASLTAVAAQADSFSGIMEAAMARMHAAMMVPPSGDADRDFATMMIPHHQGAIEMAVAELSYGKDERLRRLAQAIIVEQRQEIAVMQGILVEKGEATPSSTMKRDHSMGEKK